MIKTIDDLKQAVRLPVAGMTVGSYTVQERLPNPGQTFWYGDGYSLNSLGLPNPGIEYVYRNVRELRAIAEDAGKTLIVSVAGFSPSEYGRLACVAAEGAHVVELNLGCPNVWDDGHQKRIASFDPELVTAILERVHAEVAGVPIGVKFPPFSDPVQLAEIDAVAALFEAVTEVVACNTFPNGFALDALGGPSITPGGGLAGLAGPALHGIALGQVRQHRAALPAHVAIIGVGGVTAGVQVRAFRHAGVDGVGIATAYWLNPASVGRIVAEYAQLEVGSER